MNELPFTIFKDTDKRVLNTLLCPSYYLFLQWLYILVYFPFFHDFSYTSGFLPWHDFFFFLV